MRLRWLLTVLLILPMYAFSDNEKRNFQLVFPKPQVPENTITNSYNNETVPKGKLTQPRSIDYPTQIIRMSAKIKDRNMSCAEVNQEIDQLFLSRITKDKFLYNTIIYCTFNPETKNAIHFAINSYFDPLDDEAVSYLKSYLDEYNGSDLFGSKFTIESAKGLVVGMSIISGVKKKPNTPPLIQYRRDHASLYFPNNYEMRKLLFTDIYDNFFSDSPNKVLPFLDKWLFPFASIVYQTVLRDSNYVELIPERIFLMENGNPIFVSDLKFYFAHSCAEHENHHCL